MHSIPAPSAVWGCAGLGLLPLLLLKAQGLALGGGLWIGLGLCLLLALGVALLMREGVSGSHLALFLFPLALAFFLRIFLMDHQTLDYQDFLSHWATFFRDNGGFAALDQPVGNYNVPYLYFMAFISYLDLPDLYLIKLFSILFDVLLAWGAMRLVRRLDGKNGRLWLPPLAFCAMLLLPTVVLNGAYWGQCDSIYAALLLHALASALEKKGAASVLLLAAAFSFKLQAIFLLPLWCVLWYAGRVKFRHLFLFPAGCVAIAAPALLAGKPVVDIVSIYVGQMGVTSSLTFNAPSIYQYIPYGVEVNTALAAKLGILAAFALTLALLALLFFRRHTLGDFTLLIAALLLAVGIPFLLPYMHERYFFSADVLALVLLCVQWRCWPQCLAIQAASLLGYLVYFTGRFQVMVRLFGRTFPMGLETTLVFFVLVSCTVLLLRECSTVPPVTP